MGKQFTISKEELARLYYQEGLTCGEIGAQYGVSDTTVSNRMREYGMERRSNYIAIPKETLERLYYEEGLNQKEIGERLGVSDCKVRHQMQEYGLNVRGKPVNIPQEEVARLYYEEGLTQEEIGERYGVTISGISQRMRKWGMETRTQSDYKIDISRETIEELYYGKKMTLKQIGEIFEVDAQTIRNRMKEYGMSRRGHWDYVYIDISRDELHELYVNKRMSAPAIAKLYGCEATVVYRRMKEHGIEVRPDGWDKQIISIAPERLEWSADFAYLVGLLVSDGGLRKTGNEVKFGSTDREMIDNYCLILGLRPDDVSPDEWPDPNAQIVHVYCDPRPDFDKPDYRVAFSDPVYRQRLESIGLTPHKSNTIGPLAIPDTYFQDFLRGEFDGDGCWFYAWDKGKCYLRGNIVSGSPVFRQWLLESVWRLTPIDTGYIFHNAVCFGTGASILLGQYMYHRPDLYCLGRKREIWQKWMDSQPTYKKLR